MEGRHYTDALPQKFELHRTFSPLVRAGRFIVRRSPTVHLAGDTWDAVRLGDTAARSEVFPLQTSRVTGAHRWRFTDGTLWSPVVRSVRFADVRIPLKFATPDVPPVPGHVEAGVDVGVPAGLADPAVTLSVILPWQTDRSDGLTVRDLLRDELSDPAGEVDGDLYETLLGFARDYLPEEPAPGWEFGLEPNTLEIEPGTSREATLSVNAGEPRGVAFAVEVVNVEDASERAVSDVVVVDCDEGGVMSILYAED